MAKFKFTLYSPYVGSDVEEEIEIDDEDLEGLSEDESEQYLSDSVRNWVLVTAEYGWTKVEV